MLIEHHQKPFLPDRQIIERARSGETEAFDQLFVKHKDGVYACLWNLLGGDADQVEEAVGAVFLYAYKGLGRFRGDASFSTWVYRIAVNEAHARIRRKRRSKLFEWLSLQAPDLPELAVPAADGPAEQLLRLEEERKLRQAVRALPEPYRTPIILHYMSGMPSQEVAGVLKRPAGTVRYQLSRGLQLLRERLGSEWTK